jgi:uncharacterized protein YcfL
VNTVPRNLSAALALALCLVGCRAVGPPLNSYVITEGRHQVEVQVENRSLENTISVEGAISERRDGLLSVQVRLRNATSTQQHVEWSVEWYDRSGLLVGDPTAWESLRLGGGEIETLRRTAPTEAANSMRLSVRRSDAVD